MPEWYCLRTKPRSEKKLAEQLSQQGYTVYCPIQIQRRKWSDRIKKVEVPVLPSYILVHCEEKERSIILQHPFAIRFLFLNGKPGIVREEEIQALKEILNPDLKLEVELIEHQAYFPGEDVEFYHPDFGQMMGQVLQDLKRELVVHIPGLQLKLRISKGRLI